MTFSIITPSYNQGEFIEETIVSVLSQQGDFAIEYIIMDGGSTDNSVEIIRKYEGMLRRGEWLIACKGISYHWTSGKDNGQADAVNKGFAQAKGEILGWVNSDDTYLPRALQKVVDCFRARPDVVMLYGNAYFTDRKSAITDSYPSVAFSLTMLAEYCFICQPSAFLRNSALIEVGEIDITLQTCMDYDLWIRFGKKFDGAIAFIEDYLATSRMYEENKTLSLREKVYEEGMATVNKHFGYVSYSWFNGYIEDIIDGIYFKNRYRSLPGIFRTIVFLTVAMQHLLHSGYVSSVPKALAILKQYQVPRWYSSLFSDRAAEMEK